MSWNHKEAFCLMQYRDDVTGEVEIIWNSRDGVTAFGCTSRLGNPMTHINWGRDICQPDFIPNIGDRIWVDLTLEAAREIKTKLVEQLWEEPFRDEQGNVVCQAMKENYETKEEAIEELAKHAMDYGGGGAPMLVEVTEEMQKDLRSQREDRRALCAALGHSQFRPPNGGRFA